MFSIVSSCVQQNCQGQVVDSGDSVDRLDSCGQVLTDVNVFYVLKQSSGQPMVCFKMFI